MLSWILRRIGISSEIIPIHSCSENYLDYFETNEKNKC